jgi:D-serine deaminase-like pyridoxal phosphate-dependent protein
MITVPTLLLDEEKCRRNIRIMSEKARKIGVTFRPHFKTHVSHEIGEWFREEEVDRITVSSLRMAQYFAEDGWKDILVAFPVNLLEIDIINDLAKRIKLSLLVESVYAVDFLGKNLQAPVEVYIKVDFGYHRTGVDHEDTEQITGICKAIAGTEKMKLTGFLSHAGNSYNARGRSEILKVHEESVRAALELKGKFMNDYPDIKISLGDTPTCSIAGDFSQIDEIRPGNFVFYDLTQTFIGSCTPEMVAVAMACPVVAVHPERNEIVIYGGSVHFSKDSIADFSGRSIYGAVVMDDGPGWGDIVENAVLARLSQEHGIVEAPPSFIDRLRPGEIIKIMPVHSCLTAHAMKRYLTLTGRTITMMS